MAPRTVQSLEMVEGGKLAEGRRCCTWPRSRCFLFILIVAVIVFFCNADIMEMTVDWSPKWWTQYNETKWWTPFKSPPHRAISPKISVSPDSTFEPTITGLTSETGSSAFPQTEVVQTTTPFTTELKEATPEPTENAPVVTLLTTQIKAVLPTPIPYVSPGLYLVEYPYEYQFILNEPEKCQQQKPFLVLIVPVAPRNRAHRDTIRNTWGSESLVLGKGVNLFFLLGLHTGEGAEQIQQQLLQESREHHDLIQSNFLDCYKNLTIKTMVMLEWLDSHCSGASYAMKIDSDMFLNVHNLVNMLLNVPKDNYMTGLVARGGAVLRDPTSKWYLPAQIFPEPQYPRYALGLGYVLSLDLPRKLVEASRHVQAVYIEDVYLGLCMRYLKIPPTDPPDWNQFHVNPVHYNRCAYSTLIATTTDGTTDRVLDWKDFKKPGPFCG